MVSKREFITRPSLRGFLVLGAFLTALAFSSAASAKVRFGFNVNIALPPGVHVNVGNYEPYYIGRVFYQPLGVWRQVYSFPVETPYGVVYEPYTYDGGRVVCRDFIPGPDAGYGQFIIEGRGHYNPQWRRPRAVNAAHNRAGLGRDHGWDNRQASRRHGDWNRSDHWNRDGNRGERGNSGGRHGNKHKHGHR